MGRDTPAEIRLGGQVLTVLRSVLVAAAPEEGCALLVGVRFEDHWSIRDLWPCLNVWEPARQRRRRFAIDPREQLQAQRWARQRGLQVLGSAHSHPTSPAEPSATDLAMAVAPTLMVIRSGLVGSGVVGQSPDPLAGLGAWWLPGDGGAPLALEIQVTP